MEMYLLKSAACLAVLLLFYKLLLERESMHVFKRFYLLASVVAAIGVPFITFTTYIEPAYENINQFTYSSETFTGIPAQTINYWPYILLGIYLLGVLFFGIKFYRNLRRLIIKIKTNPKLTTGNFINVLLSEEIHPHTFFSYIFFNREKYLLDQIPKDVKIHEEAHASQRHSLDVILVELLQIIFWFNPLIFLLKDAMKLNHEFLADREVIKKGISTSRYQQTLLAYSSVNLQSDLVNPINYSSIKKRFTVMKSKTSRRAFWVRTLLLLPLIALIFYGFTDRAVVVKEAVQTTNTFRDSIPVTPKTPLAAQGLYYTAAQSPPSKNSNTLEYVLELAKRGASFYIGPHEYSLEEVIKMVKKSTNEVSIDVSKYPVVVLGGC